MSSQGRRSGSLDYSRSVQHLSPKVVVLGIVKTMLMVGNDTWFRSPKWVWSPVLNHFIALGLDAAVGSSSDQKKAAFGEANL